MGAAGIIENAAAPVVIAMPSHAYLDLPTIPDDILGRFKLLTHSGMLPSR